VCRKAECCCADCRGTHLNKQPRADCIKKCWGKVTHIICKLGHFNEKEKKFKPMEQSSFQHEGTNILLSEKFC
jgi:hypothetical protein